MGKETLLLVLFRTGTCRLAPYMEAYLQAVRPLATRVALVVPAAFADAPSLADGERLRVVRLPAGSPVNLAAAQPCLADWISGCERLILTDDTQFGPFGDLAEIFAQMERRNADVWSMLRVAARPDCPAHLDPAFLVCEAPFLARANWQTLAQRPLTREVLTEQGLCAAFYADACRYDFPCGENNFDYTAYYPWELMTEQGYPFLKRAAFTGAATLDYTHRESLPRAVRRIEAQYPALADAMWDCLLETMEPGALKDRLQLYHIVDADTPASARPAPLPRTAVCLHLFYPDLLPETLRYADAVPPEVDLYITTHGEEQIRMVREHLQASGRSRFQVLEAGQRGRDAAALLVAMRPYLLQYDYLCFVHDKKTSGGRGPRMLGDTFRSLVFENLLPDANYLYKVLDLFAAHPRLGFLSPPCPITLGYQEFSGGFGNEWTNCYDVTRALAEKLDLRYPPRRDDRLFTVSNTFWCRTDALRKLFAVDWKVEDFPAEPLGDDGTLNHAVERIYAFVARDAGYYSALLLEKHFAASYLCNLDNSLAQMLQICRESITLRDTEDIRSALRTSSRDYQPLLAARNLLQEENEKKSTYIGELTDQLSDATSQRDLLDAENLRKETYIGELTDQLSDATSQRDLLDAENLRKEAYIGELTGQLSDATSRRDLLEAENLRKEQYINELTAQLSDATTRRDLLEAENLRKERYIEELKSKLRHSGAKL